MTKTRKTLGLDAIVQKNIEAIASIEKAKRDARKPSDRVADSIARFCGSIAFIYIHIVWFGGWILINSLPMLKALRFDPPPFGALTLIVSLEAIFLSTFILISQNREQEMADERNELDLQINLLAEQESSQIIRMLKQIMDHHGFAEESPEAEALESQTNAKEIAKTIRKKIEK